MDQAALLDACLSGPGMLRAAVACMSRGQMIARPIPGRWSVLDVVCHLVDTDANIAHRIKRGGADVASVLAVVGIDRGALPKKIRVDNGTEFTSKARDHWAYWNHVELDFSRPGMTTIVVKHGSRLFSAEFAESMACCRIVMLRRGLLLWPLVGARRAMARRACVGCIDRGEQESHPRIVGIACPDS
jgi:hypothetical protein